MTPGFLRKNPDHQLERIRILRDIRNFDIKIMYKELKVIFYTLENTVITFKSWLNIRNLLQVGFFVFCFFNFP
jgi:hypothetical protein